MNASITFYGIADLNPLTQRDKIRLATIEQVLDELGYDGGNYSKWGNYFLGIFKDETGKYAHFKERVEELEKKIISLLTD